MSFHLNVDASGLLAVDGGFEGGGQFVEALHQGPESAKGSHCSVITSGCAQRAAKQAILAIGALLNHVFGVPAQIVTHYGHNCSLFAYGRIKFRKMEAGCAVTHQQHHR